MNFSEIALILLVALIAFGPKQLRQLSYKFGKLLGLLQKLRQTTQQNFQQLQNEITYHENLAKAQAAEEKLKSVATAESSNQVTYEQH